MGIAALAIATDRVSAATARTTDLAKGFMSGMVGRRTLAFSSNWFGRAGQNCGRPTWAVRRPRSVFYPRGMGKVWVLHTETKGTGATMVPLERVTERKSVAEPLVVPRKPQPRAAPAPQPKAPRRFRVVDVMTRQTLVDDVGARGAIDVLRDVRSIVDVNIYVASPDTGGWRMLTLEERRTLWKLRDD